MSLPGETAEEQLTLTRYESVLMNRFRNELNYCGYGIYRTGFTGVYNTDKLEEQGITHVLSLGDDTPGAKSFVEAKAKSDKFRYYEKFIRDKNDNSDKAEDQGGWEGFWKDKKVLKFIEDGMPSPEHPDTRLLVHCRHGAFRTGFVVRGIMIKYKEHSLLQAYRRVDHNTLLIRDYPNAVEALRTLPKDESKWTPTEELDKFLCYCEEQANCVNGNKKEKFIRGKFLPKDDDKLPLVSFDGCPEDPYEKDKRVQKVEQWRVDFQAKMPRKR